MGLGAAVGMAAAVWVTAGVDRVGLPWLVAVGLVKLTIAASLSLIGAGATLLRIANRAAVRRGDSAIGAAEPPRLPHR